MADLVPLLLATALSGTWWFARNAPHRRLIFITAAQGVVLYTLPWFSGTHLASRSITALACCAIYAPKLLDAVTAQDTWKTRAFRDWVFYLINPFVLCYRQHLQDPPRPAIESGTRCLRGAVQMGVGGVWLYWGFTTHWATGSFWLEHFTKLVGVYLAVIDGGFVLVNGWLGVFGGTYMRFCRHPILARTPADFWRRYNRDAGRFLRAHVYARLTGLPVPARIGVVFTVNGLLHEYLVFAVSGRVTGAVFAFFMFQAVGVVLTWRIRPTGLSAIVAILLTIAFNVVTSVLFFYGVNTICPWYTTWTVTGQ